MEIARIGIFIAIAGILAVVGLIAGLRSAKAISFPAAHAVGAERPDRAILPQEAVHTDGINGANMVLVRVACAFRAVICPGHVWWELNVLAGCSP